MEGKLAHCAINKLEICHQRSNCTIFYWFLFSQLLAMDPERIQLHYRIGTCVIQSFCEHFIHCIVLQILFHEIRVESIEKEIVKLIYQ